MIYRTTTCICFTRFRFVFDVSISIMSPNIDILAHLSLRKPLIHFFSIECVDRCEEVVLLQAQTCASYPRIRLLFWLSLYLLHVYENIVMYRCIYKPRLIRYKYVYVYFSHVCVIFSIKVRIRHSDLSLFQRICVTQMNV